MGAGKWLVKVSGAPAFTQFTVTVQEDAPDAPRCTATTECASQMSFTCDPLTMTPHVEHFNGGAWVGYDGLSAPVYTDPGGRIQSQYRVCVPWTSDPTRTSCSPTFDFYDVPGSCTPSGSGGCSSGGSHGGGRGACRGKTCTTGSD